MGQGSWRVAWGCPVSRVCRQGNPLSPPLPWFDSCCRRGLLTSRSAIPFNTKKPAKNTPGRLTRGECDEQPSQAPAEDSGENCGKSQDHHCPKVGSWLAR